MLYNPTQLRCYLVMTYYIKILEKEKNFVFIAYYDEAGDDGYPQYSSPIFVLTSLYLYYLNWKEIYTVLHQFRRQLKTDFGIPMKRELHSKKFILNKNPFRGLNLVDKDRILVIDLFCDLIARLEVKIVNVVINKKAIKTDRYDVLDRALTYSIQRIENDLNKIDPAEKFMIVTDEGRVGKMRKTSRKIQRINFIPSKFGAYAYRQEIKSLIEEPLPKSSKESYFIQLSDTVAFIVYLYSVVKLGVGEFSSRMPAIIDRDKISDWMGRLKNSFNLEASSSDEYGVVCYPK